ncbi:MBL fold metallo-hydrolase [Ammoniphilus sp. 3BR4]|uniref:MBL fold metallo-hydrolase n=1 Tax=Ammoniphilus sp. 3BR4 TaxID=3158265 RepID=UPI003466FF64
MLQPRRLIDLGNRIHLVDGYDLGVAGRTGTYVICEEQLTLVETSASPSVPYILRGLQDLGLDPKEVRYIIVTHIHLDHSGGAGLLLKSCPNGNVVVHPKGARHLAHPQRLIEGARAVYGEKFDELFDPILPIPEDKLITMADQDTLRIGPHCLLQFLDTPGHANHHFSIYDSVSNGIFTGDTIGVYYPELVQQGAALYLPSTSPNQFNPEDMMESMERIRQLNVDRIYFGHFGMSEEPSEVYRQLEYWLPLFLNTAEQAFTDEKSEEAIAARLYQQVEDWLTDRGISTNDSVYSMIQLDLEVGAKGLFDYIKKKR